MMFRKIVWALCFHLSVTFSSFKIISVALGFPFFQNSSIIFLMFKVLLTNIVHYSTVNCGFDDLMFTFSNSSPQFSRLKFGRYFTYMPITYSVKSWQPKIGRGSLPLASVTNQISIKVDPPSTPSVHIRLPSCLSQKPHISHAFYHAGLSHHHIYLYSNYSSRYRSCGSPV